MTQLTETDLRRTVQVEIEALHKVIETWIRGDQPADNSWFGANFSQRLAPGFVNIQPAGKALTRAELIGDIETMHGANPAFAISIRDVRLVAIFAACDAVVATYIEDQTGARNSAARNSRVSTVTMRLVGEMPQWLHLQETAIL